MIILNNPECDTTLQDAIHDAVDAKVEELGSRGIRSLALARMDNEDGKWKFLGILTFSDPPRRDTKFTIDKCHHYGVRVKMITGDHLVIAKETARVVGMGPKIYSAAGLPVLDADGHIPEGLVEKYGMRIWCVILTYLYAISPAISILCQDHKTNTNFESWRSPADGFASVFPEHKYLIVETLRKAGFRCGMTGDCVNDAPALKKADVGIAVQGATDAARAAADLVITAEGLSTIIDAIEISREIFQRLKNFISYRIAATLQLLTFFFISVFAFSPEKYYEKNGFADPKDSTAFFNVPRKSFVCPTGYDGSGLQKEFKNMDFNKPEALFATQGCKISLPICKEIVCALFA